jgi:hypothetical protein
LFIGKFKLDGKKGKCDEKCVIGLENTKQPSDLILIMRMGDKDFDLVYSLAGKSPDGMTNVGGSLMVPFNIFGKDASAKISITKKTLKVIIKPSTENGLISKMGEKWTITQDEVTSELKFKGQGRVMIAKFDYNKLNLRAGLAENIFYLKIGDKTAELKFIAANLPPAFE